MTTFKQSTAYTHQFLMVLSSDHISGATGKNGSLVVKIGKNGAAGVTAGGTTAEVDSTNLPGVYSIALTTTDTGSLGSLALAATATGCDPTNETHRIDSQIFPDLNINASGRVLISNNLQQNTALNGYTFPMTSSTTGLRQTGLTVTAQRTLGSGGFAPCANSVTEITGTGIYAINLAATDLNAVTVGLLFTATGANDLYIPITPTP